MSLKEDEVVVDDFGAGWVVTTKRLPGETDKAIQRRYARYLWENKPEFLRKIQVRHGKRQRSQQARK